jgi:hypothetical protein
MKRNLMRILSIMLLGLLPAANASENLATISSTCPSGMSVVTTSPAYTFQAYVSALFLKPGGSNTHYAAQAFPIPVPSPNWQIFDVQPGYHVGFDIGFTGFFHRLDTSLRTNWEHFNSTSRANQDAGESNMIGPFFAIGPDEASYKIAHARLKFNFDEFNIDYGQLIRWGHRLQTTPFVGITFARISQKLCTTYANTDDTVNRTITTPITFSGAGLRIGADYIYCLRSGFQLAGRSTAALLAGSINTHTTYDSVFPLADEVQGVTSPNIQHTRACSRDQIVPAFSQRLGVGYQFFWCDHYEVGLEAGYQIQVYLQALQSNDMGSEVVTPPEIPDRVGVFARTFQRTVSNFALSGAYVTLTIGF